VDTSIWLILPVRLADQASHPRGGGQVRLPERVVIPLADLPAGVTDLAHHDVLADLGVVHRRVAGATAAWPLPAGCCRARPQLQKSQHR
jgi:hypothetical protein